MLTTTLIAGLVMGLLGFFSGQTRQKRRCKRLGHVDR
jgi:hypothetical protein